MRVFPNHCSSKNLSTELLRSHNSLSMEMKQPEPGVEHLTICDELSEKEEWHIVLLWISIAVSGIAIIAVCVAGIFACHFIC